MNATTQAEHPHGPAALVTSMVHTRLELAAIDLESHLAASATAVFIGVAATVIAILAMAFAGITVIAVFWDTHRLAAVFGTTFAYVALTALLARAAHARWLSRPPVFANVLRELERDRAVLRSQS